jgi:hypothetical protein
MAIRKTHFGFLVMSADHVVLGIFATREEAMKLFDL